MKKGIVLVVAALLAACSNEEAVNENAARMSIVNETNVAVTSIEMDVTQMNKHVSTQGGANADGSALAAGDALSFQWLEEDVDFTQPVAIAVRAKVDGHMESVGTLSSFTLKKGETIHTTLTEHDGELYVEMHN